MGYYEKGYNHTDAYCPIHPELSDDESWEGWYYREYKSVHGSYLSICFVSSLLGDEDRHQSWEGYHTDIAHHHSEHRQEDEEPEPRIPYISPRRFREICEHPKCEWIEKEGSNGWYEYNRFLAMMIDERTEPDTTEEIEHEIHSSEHPSNEDRMCLEIEPEGNRKPDEHISKSSDCSVDEDVGEEGGWFHGFGVSVIARYEAIQISL